MSSGPSPYSLTRFRLDISVLKKCGWDSGAGFWDSGGPVSRMDIWKSGFLRWISGSSVCRDGYLEPENGYLEMVSSFDNPPTEQTTFIGQ
jgi:hypothetical protein